MSVSIDGERARQLKRDDAFKNGITRPQFPGITFKGEEALAILDEMEKSQSESKKWDDEFSEEEMADIAKKYFRINNKPNR